MKMFKQNIKKIVSYLQTLLSIAILLSTFTGSKDTFSLSECYFLLTFILTKLVMNILKILLNIV